MSSTSSACFSPVPHIQIHRQWRNPSKAHKITQRTHFSLFIPLPNKHLTISFPSTLSLPSLNPEIYRNSFYQNCLQSQIILESPEGDLVETVDGQLRNSEKIKNEIQLNDRIFMQDPPWVNALIMKDFCESRNGLKLEFKEIEREKYNLLRRRQIKAETEAWENMVEEYREFVKEMRDKELAPNLPQVKALFLGWFEPLKKAIEKEQKLQRSRKQKAIYAYHIDMLPADKMAVIVMHKMMALLMVGNEAGCVRLVQAALQIGAAIEQEVLTFISSFGYFTSDNAYALVFELYSFPDPAFVWDIGYDDDDV